MSTNFTTLACLLVLSACARERMSEQSHAAAPTATMQLAQTTHEEPVPIVGTAIFRAEDIERHRNELALSAEQSREIENLKMAFTLDTESLRENLNSARGELTTALNQPGIDDVELLRRTRVLTGHEGELKVRHMQLLLQLRSVLTSAQRQRLRNDVVGR